MEIKVIYTRDGEGIINDCDLEYMIRSRKIIAFERQGEWVMINRGPIRKKPFKPFLWDRRKSGGPKLLVFAKHLQSDRVQSNMDRKKNRSR